MMGFLKAVFWMLVLLFLVSFTLVNINNEAPITIFPTSVKPDYLIRVPSLAIGSFLLGFVPYFLLHRFTRWSLRKKLSQAKRELEASKHEVAPALPKDGE
jgi:hypothetical protein